MKPLNILNWKITVALGLASLFTVSVAQAANITWDATGTFTDNTVLALAGPAAREVYGVDAGGSGTQTTANGYTFADNVTSGNMTIGGGPSSFGGFLTVTTGDAAMDSILTFGFYGGAMPGTLNNLTVGVSYTAIALLVDTRGVHPPTDTFNVTDGVTTSPNQVYAFSGGSPAVGGYIIGTFTASATTQTFTVSASAGGQYNCILLISNPPPLVPSPILISNTQPATASVGVNGQVVFTAAFSNAPPVNLQWQVIANGVTNAVSTGVVTVTNSGIVSSTLTFTNLQLADSGSYRLKAVNATNSLGVAYSAAAPLTVSPLILWLATGTFTDNSVLALAGAVSNEVYGVDFGGSGLQTTANGYSFDDYATSGNMSIAGGGFGLFNNYLGGGGSSGDFALDTLLTYGLYGGAVNTGTLKNLTVGQTYKVLALLADTRTGAGSQNAGTAFHGTEGVFTSPNQPFVFGGGTPAIGGYALGTFTALSTNQALSIISQTLNGNYGNCQYNAILLVKTTPPVFPPIYLASNTQPATASAAEGSQIVFTAAFRNSPALNLQWQKISGGITNNVNAGVVNVTNLGIVSSTLTLTNLQLTDSGSYRLKAVDATNSLNFAYSSAAPLTVVPVITWGATGTFANNSVLVLAGPASNEVYGVSFGGSGAQTTANGYTFDDNVTSGNMSIAGGTSAFGGYMNGVATTGDAALDTILANGLYNSAAPNTGTLNNLTVGQAYTVLVLLDDTRTSPGPSSTFTVTDGVTTSPSQQFQFANGSPSVGGYIMGTFTATATTQALSVQNGGNSQYNAILLAKFSLVTPPTLNASAGAGGNLILTGTGGTPNYPYTILSTTNLLTPLANWTVSATGTLNGTGALSNAIPLSTSQPAAFFRLRLP